MRHTTCWRMLVLSPLLTGLGLAGAISLRGGTVMLRASPGTPATASLSWHHHASARHGVSTRKQRHGLDQRLQCLAAIRQVILDTLRPHFQGASRVALLGVPSHGNLGDNVLHLADVEVMALFGKSPAVTCGGFFASPSWLPCPTPETLLDTLGPHPLLLLHPGGNWGDVWRGENPARIAYLRELDDELAKRKQTASVVQLPQSLFYANSSIRLRDTTDLASLRHIKLTVYARQQASLAHAPPVSERLAVALMPDLAFVLGPRAHLTKPTVDVLFVLRSDCERAAGVSTELASSLAQQAFHSMNATFKIQDWLVSNKPKPGELELGSPSSFPLIRWHMARELIGSARLVITDRLHVSIVASLLGRPVIILDNSYGKVTGVRDLVLETHPACTPTSLREHRAPDLAAAVGMARSVLTTTRQAHAGDHSVWRAWSHGSVD